MLVVPTIYLCWAFYLVAIIIGGQENVIEGKTALITSLVVLGLLALTGGVISIARNCAMQQVSGGRMIWLGASRTCLSGASCVLLFLGFMIASGGSLGAKMEMAVANGAMMPADEMAGKVPAEEMAGTLPASKWQVRCQRRMVRICLFMDGSEERFRPAILWRVAAH